MKKIKFEPTYKREDGLTVVYGKTIPIPKGYKTQFQESGIVVFPPGTKGGNHKHPRIEVLYSTDNLTIVWIDKYGKKHKESMAPKNGKYTLFITEPEEPHAVINNTNRALILIEFANKEQHNVELINIV